MTGFGKVGYAMRSSFCTPKRLLGILMVAILFQFAASPIVKVETAAVHPVAEFREAVVVSVQPWGSVTVNGYFDSVNVSFIDTSYWCFEDLNELVLLVGRDFFSTKDGDALRQLPYTATLRAKYRSSLDPEMALLRAGGLAVFIEGVFNLNLTLDSWDRSVKSFYWNGNASFQNATAIWQRMLQPYGGLSELFTEDYLNFNAPHLEIKFTLRRELNRFVWDTALFITGKAVYGSGDHIFSLNDLLERSGSFRASVNAFSSWVNVSLPVSPSASKPPGIFVGKLYALDLLSVQRVIEDLQLSYSHDYPAITRFPNLEVSKVSVGSKQSGENFTVTVYVTNLGNDTAYHIRIYDALPRMANLVSGKLNSTAFSLEPNNMFILSYTVNATAGDYTFPPASVTYVNLHGHGFQSTSNKMRVEVALSPVFIGAGGTVCIIIVAVLYYIGLIRWPFKKLEK